jgi:hypothetical protein
MRPPRAAQHATRTMNGLVFRAAVPASWSLSLASSTSESLRLEERSTLEEFMLDSLQAYLIQAFLITGLIYCEEIEGLPLLDRPNSNGGFKFVAVSSFIGDGGFKFVAVSHSC